MDPKDLMKMTPRQVHELARSLAKKLDSPELRKLYAEQNLTHDDLENSLKKATQEIDEIFKHNKDSR